MTLTLTALPDIPLIRPGDDLGAILLAALAKAGLFLMDGDVLVLAQKIVSKAEGRMVNLTQVTPSPRAIELAVQVEKDARFVELVLQESLEVLRTRPGTLIVEHRRGFICANAGIDHSNVEGSWGNPDDWVLLLPVDADASAERIRRCVAKGSSLKLGVMIIDSHGRAWRNGVVGVCIGLAGLPALVDLRGEPDMLGLSLIHISEPTRLGMISY